MARCLLQGLSGLLRQPDKIKDILGKLGDARKVSDCCWAPFRTILNFSVFMTNFSKKILMINSFKNLILSSISDKIS